MNDEPIKSEMEAMLLFRQHGPTTWEGDDAKQLGPRFLIGGRELWHPTFKRLRDRGLVEKVDLGGDNEETGGIQYRLAEKFR